MKRILAMVLSLALIATMAISGSVAYLYDQDDDVNVFAVGNVDIVQYEEERTTTTESGLKDFTQKDQKHPMVESGTVNNPTKDIHGNAVTLRDPSYYRNYVDKIVSVENKGDSEAFVRNIVAIPTGLEAAAEDVDWLEVDWFDFPAETSAEWTRVEPITKDVEIDGVLYDLYVFNYSNSADGGKLQPTDFTAPTLLGFGLSKNVGYDDDKGQYFYETSFNSSDRTYININPKEMKIYVATQAVQTHGFDDFNHAFDATFGTIGKKNHPWYESKSLVGDKYYTWDQMKDPANGFVTVDGTTLTSISDNVVDLVIPDNAITSINNNVFAGKTSLQTVEIGEGVSIIGNNAFRNCSALKSVVFPSSLTTIGSYAFSGCSALTVIEFYSAKPSMGNYAFNNCPSLTTVIVPAGAADFEKYFPYAEITYRDSN